MLEKKKKKRIAGTVRAIPPPQCERDKGQIARHNDFYKKSFAGTPGAVQISIRWSDARNRQKKRDNERIRSAILYRSPRDTVPGWRLGHWTMVNGRNWAIPIEFERSVYQTVIGNLERSERLYVIIHYGDLYKQMILISGLRSWNKKKKISLICTLKYTRVSFIL